MLRLVLALFLAPSLAFAQPFPKPAELPTREAVDVLTCLDGSKVTTAEQWNAKRKPELKALFEHYMYGRQPAAVKIDVKQLHEDKSALGGKATLREVQISFGPADCPKVNLLIVMPNGAKTPSPVFVGYNFTGNHSLVNDAKIALPTSWMRNDKVGVKENKATEGGRGLAVNDWALEQTIDRGYAVVTAYYGDIDPDRTDARLGIQNHLWMKDKSPADDDAGSVMTWAWGLSRMVDYLQTLDRIDAKKIAVVGHSRLGKATIVAGAFDDRFALVIPHQAGCGGTAPSRTKDPKNEGVERINKAFPHWFDANFNAFGADPTRLPFDQNCLIALCAPRPVLLTTAVEDVWSNPAGQFQMLKAAEPAYKLIGSAGCSADKMPEVNALIDSPLGYWIRPGKHSMNKDDWKTFCDYADKRLK